MTFFIEQVKHEGHCLHPIDGPGGISPSLCLPQLKEVGYGDVFSFFFNKQFVYTNTQV